MKYLEVIFDYVQLADTKRVMCCIFMLMENTRIWWEGARLIVTLATLTWDEFKWVFYDSNSLLMFVSVDQGISDSKEERHDYGRLC